MSRARFPRFRNRGFIGFPPGKVASETLLCVVVRLMTVKSNEDAAEVAVGVTTEVHFLRVDAPAELTIVTPREPGMEVSSLLSLTQPSRFKLRSLV